MPFTLHSCPRDQAQDGLRPELRLCLSRTPTPYRLPVRAVPYKSPAREPLPASASRESLPKIHTLYVRLFIFSLKSIYRLFLGLSNKDMVIGFVLNATSFVGWARINRYLRSNGINAVKRCLQDTLRTHKGHLICSGWIQGGLT